MAILPICVESLLFTYIVLIIDIQGTYSLRVIFSLYLHLCGHGMVPSRVSDLLLEASYSRTLKHRNH